MQLTEKQLDNLIGRKVLDNDGDKVGEISDIYMDDVTGEPEWLTVRTGLFGTKVNFVPLAEANLQEGDVQVPYSKQQIKDAPNHDVDEALSQAEEASLYSHYGLEYSQSSSPSGLASGTTVGNASDSGNAMTRSEEELVVDKSKQETGKVRLHKYLVTEEQTVTVPVTREKVRIEREPITDANIDQALSGPELTESEHEVTLHEEQVEVSKRVVPKEQIRLSKETEVGTEQVNATVQKEQVEVDDNSTK